MRIVLAPDSFKESISAARFCQTIGPILREHGHEVISIPLADGGEGTVDAVLAAVAGERVVCDVIGPLGDPVSAHYALVDEGRTAIVEIAAASGLQLVPIGRRDALRASTFGTGEVICHAIARGARKVVVGLGGSATTDGGAGAAQALGAILLDADGRPISSGGAALLALERIDLSEVRALLDGIEMIAACDVANPLAGPNGSARVYGPQKSASPAEVELLDRALSRFAEVVERDTGVGIAQLPGAGAAGGLAGGLVALCGARIESGFALIAGVTGLEEQIAAADCVVTGEGKLDAQTLQGKTVAGVCRIAREHGVSVYVIAGVVEGRFEPARAYELAALAGDAETSRRDPEAFLQEAARRLVVDLELGC